MQLFIIFLANNQLRFIIDCQSQSNLSIINCNIFLHMANSNSFFDRLVHDFIKAKHINYSEECIPYYIDDHIFSIQDINDLRNDRNQKIKCTIIRHRVSTKNKHNQSSFNRKCIVYLHGLGSSRLQALSLVNQLPKNYCICMFDMSGSGKSQGEHITYGLKQSQDIDHVISYLFTKKNIKEFIIWGRSMGAVATLLYAIKYYSPSHHQQPLAHSLNSSVKNSSVKPNSTCQLQSQELVTAIVLDSPFQNFRSIAKQIAIKKLSVPNFVVDIALQYVNESFSRILSSSIGQQYNPFLINLDTEIKLSLPVVFLYSQKDEIVPASHCEIILKNIRSKYQKILLNQCTHNQTRPAYIIQSIFQKLQKYSRQRTYQNNTINESFSRQSIMNSSMQRKRGIFVYTPSKQLKRTIQIGENSTILPLSRVSIQKRSDENKMRSPNRYKNNANRRNLVSLECSRRQNQDTLTKKEETICSQNFYYLNTIDSQTHKMITKKLVHVKQKQATHTIARGLRGKLGNIDRRKEIKLTHHKYLQ